MRSQSTKETLRSLDKADFLGTSTRTHMPSVSPLLTETFSVSPPQGEGQGPILPDWNHVQEAHLRLLDDASREVRESSQVYRQNRVVVFNFHRRRDDEAQKLRQRYRSVASRVGGSYRTEVLRLLGLNGPPARKYTAVREQCLDFIRLARDPEVLAQVGEPLPGVPPLDFEALAREMSDAVQVFEKVLDELTEAKKARDASRVAKDEAQARHDRVYVNLARIQEAYYRLAGLDELADRIRMTIPKRASRPQEPDSTDSPSGSAPGSETTTP